MKTIQIYLLLPVLFFFSISDIDAQESNDSLAYYLDMAKNNNPLLKAKYNEYLSVLEKVNQVGSLPDPELSAGFYLTPMEETNGRRIADFTLMQMFPWFGSLKSAKNEAASMANAKLAAFNEAELRVTMELKTLWYQLYSNKKELDYNKEAVTFLKSIESIVLVKYKNTSLSNSSGGNMSDRNGSTTDLPSKKRDMNMGSSGSMETMDDDNSKTNNSSMDMSSGDAMGGGSGLIELFRVQMEILELENANLLLVDEQKTLMSKFNSLLNRELSQRIAIADTLDLAVVSDDYQSIVDSIRTNNPMISMLEADRQAYEYKMEMSRKMGYPMMGVGLNYSIFAHSEEGSSHSEMSGQDMIMPMISLSLPIYRKKYNAMVKESEMMKNSTEELILNSKNDLETKYIQTLENVYDAKRRMNLYIQQQNLAQHSVNLLVSQYSTTGSNFEEILRMQIRLLNYKTQSAKALSDYNISVATIEKLIN